MKIDNYIYSFSNASITLRVMEYLSKKQLPLESVAVINLIDRWLVQVKMKDILPTKLAKDVKAFLDEMGIQDKPSAKVKMALAQLEAGICPTEVMNRYRVVIVAYGQPEKKEVEIFREQIVERLGYCPQNMA
ncbi:MAG: hypothetical protein Tsb0014_01060 [Pleurocapsa sp.]